MFFIGMMTPFQKPIILNKCYQKQQMYPATTMAFLTPHHSYPIVTQMVIR